MLVSSASVKSTEMDMMFEFRACLDEPILSTKDEIVHALPILKKGPPW